MQKKGVQILDPLIAQQHLDTSSVRSRVSCSILTQQRPQQGIAQQHPLRCRKYKGSRYRATTSSLGSVRSRVLRSNILTQQPPQQGIAQQHPFRCRKKGVQILDPLLAQQRPHSSSVRSRVSHSNLRPALSAAGGIAQQHPHPAASAAGYRAATSI